MTPKSNSAPRRTAGAERYRDLATAEELTEQNVQAIVELERAAKANMTRSQRWAQAIAAFCGTMTFFYVHVVLFGAWILFNSLPAGRAIDPFPFTFLTLMVSLEAIFLSTFILISQNEENRLTERRNALDLQINLLTEQENTKMLRMLSAIAKKVGVEVDDDPALAALEQATQPQKLAQQIDRASGGDAETPPGKDNPRAGET